MQTTYCRTFFFFPPSYIALGWQAASPWHYHNTNKHRIKYLCFNSKWSGSGEQDSRETSAAVSESRVHYSQSRYKDQSVILLRCCLFCPLEKHAVRGENHTDFVLSPFLFQSLGKSLVGDTKQAAGEIRVKQRENFRQEKSSWEQWEVFAPEVEHSVLAAIHPCLPVDGFNPQTNLKAFTSLKAHGGFQRRGQPVNHTGQALGQWEKILIFHI